MFTNLAREEENFVNTYMYLYSMNSTMFTNLAQEEENFVNTKYVSIHTEST